MIDGRFLGFVSETGTLTLDHLPAFRAYVRRFAGKEVEIDIYERGASKTRRQERGFHAMVRPWALTEGWRIDDLKQVLLKEIFGTKEMVNPVTGEVTLVLREPHTSTLTKQQYHELIERTLEIAAGAGHVLEAPSEYRERKERERKAVARQPRKGRAA